MAITNGYATLADLKARLDLDTTDLDTILESLIEAASREIDGWCGRSFFQAEDEARVYTAEWPDLLPVDDLVSVTAIATDEDGDRTYETTWATTDYDLAPFNAALTGTPYTRIALAPNGTRAFPRLAKGVRVTGTWGWPAVPKAISEACLLQAARLYKRKDAPFGIAGSAELGELRTLSAIDPDVKSLLAPYRRFVVGSV